MIHLKELQMRVSISKISSSVDGMIAYQRFSMIDLPTDHKIRFSVKRIVGSGQLNSPSQQPVVLPVA